MANSNMLNPPVFKDGEMLYEEWRKDIKLWTILTDLPKSKMAIAVHLSLSGRARKATSELTEDELKAENGIANLLAKLDKVYLQDANWKIFHNYLGFENFSRTNEKSIEDFFHEFDAQCLKVKECGFELPEAALACRLLRSFDISDVQFQLVLTTIPFLTLDDMRKTLERLFTHNGIICIPKENEVPIELSNIKDEPVLNFSQAYQEQKKLESRSSYYEEVTQKEQDKSHMLRDRQRIIGEIEHNVVNEVNDDAMENMQGQFHSNRINVKEELPDSIEENDYKLHYFEKDQNLSNLNDQEKTRNENEGLDNPVQSTFHNNETIDSWLKRNLCTVNIKNLDQQQNKGRHLNEDLSTIETINLRTNNTQDFQSKIASEARKSGRQAKLPTKFKEYVYVPPKKKSHSPKVGNTQISKKKNLKSNASVISTIEKQESPSKILARARKSGRQAKLPVKLNEYLYVPPKKKSHSPKVGHTHSSKESPLELDKKDIFSATNMQEGCCHVFSETKLFESKMPRNRNAKPGTKKRKKYEENEIQKATDAIKRGLSVRKAEKKYNIPKSVLNRYMKKSCVKGNLFSLNMKKRYFLEMLL